jgi:hypothetical protein
MKTETIYLSKEKQQELIPNHTGIKYHNATFNKYSENRNWMIDISCFFNPNSTFYHLKTDKEKNEPIRYSSNFTFTNKQKALSFIKEVNGGLTKHDKNFHPRKSVKCSDGSWRIIFYNE